MTDQEIDDDIKKFWDSHHNQMNDLIEKYIGKHRLAVGNEVPDVWFKKQFYINRIRDLMFQAGRCNQALRRCKPDSPTWEKYEKTEQELNLLAEHLAGKVLSM